MNTRTVSSQCFLDAPAPRPSLPPPAGFALSSPPNRSGIRLPALFRLCPLFFGFQAGLILARLLAQLPR